MQDVCDGNGPEEAFRYCRCTICDSGDTTGKASGRLSKSDADVRLTAVPGWLAIDEHWELNLRLSLPACEV
jgi:hypothetical protein